MRNFLISSTTGNAPALFDAAQCLLNENWEGAKRQNLQAGLFARIGFKLAYICGWQLARIFEITLVRDSMQLQ